MPPAPISNFKLTRDADGVAWLLFDREGASANTLSADVIEELDKVLAELESQRPTGLVIRSAKNIRLHRRRRRQRISRRDRSAAGRDRDRPRACGDRPARGAARFRRVAVIHGFCLGGGLEVALACQMRIAIEDARFGFPEVMLGLHPGLGGTARFTQLVNPMQAMTMMLTGKTIDARKAKSLGLVDAVTQERHVRNAVKDAVFGRLKRAQAGPAQHHSRTSVRSAAFSPRACAREAEKAAPHEHYPAPYALIDLWEKHGGDKARDAARRKDLVRQADGDADGAEPDPRVLPARADEEARRQRQQDQARPRHRRRRDGRRHRRLVRQSGHAGDARRHEGRSRSPARSSAPPICSARSCASAPTCATRWTG